MIKRIALIGNVPREYYESVRHELTIEGHKVDIVRLDEQLLSDMFVMQGSHAMPNFLASIGISPMRTPKIIVAPDCLEHMFVMNRAGNTLRFILEQKLHFKLDLMTASCAARI